MSQRPLILILLSSLLFGLSPPLAKLLTRKIPPLALAGLLYLGVFVGLSLYSLGWRLFAGGGRDRDAIRLAGRDYFWLAGAIIAGGILAPVSLLSGLARTTGFATSLLLNLEGVTTALIAVALFKENAGSRLWLALACMTIGGISLAWDPRLGRFDPVGPLLVLFAMICWGFDNNFTRNISDKDPVQTARIKGLVSGGATLLLALALGRAWRIDGNSGFALLVGALCYGLSLVLFIKALRGFGAFRTGAFFSLAPFIGAAFSFVILREPFELTMIPALLFMATGVGLIVTEKHAHAHRHKGLTHTHSHRHADLHHLHPHAGPVAEPHSHEHTHEALDHVHGHWPDIHHRHEH